MHVCFVLFPDFPLLPFALAKEVLSTANRCSGRTLFTWQIRGPLGASINGEDGVHVDTVEADWSDSSGFDLVLLCAGSSGANSLPMGLRAFLHNAARNGSVIGGLVEGGVLLARAGLLGDHAVSLPPDVDGDTLPTHIHQSKAQFTIERQRLTVATGMATTDAMLAWLSRCVSPTLSVTTARALTNAAPTALGHEPLKDPLLARMQTIMAAHVETPLPLEEIADALDLSPKQMRLRCHKVFAQTPLQVYTDVRLEHARRLAQETALSVSEIAKATGFASPSAFTRSFRARFGDTPRAIRSGISLERSTA